MKFYDLWSVASGNLVGEYATQDEALADACGMVRAGWPAEDLTLGWGDSEDAEQGGEVATGAALRDLIFATEERSRRSA
jgi:hypothetical protein